MLAAASWAFTAQAADYSALSGLKGAKLKQAVKELAAFHKAISYGENTWKAFEQTDVVTIDGRLAWRDMYSNRLVYVATGHDGMNIEHSVANSWWGGVRNDAYKDLYHLNPSDADANNRKNNNPLGEISGTPSWSNGLTRIGAPTAATGGGSKTVFEPADEYKGDFARAYFYIFTIYDDIAWETSPAYMYDRSAYPTLKPWATDMLLRWAADDPVDAREIARARAVAGLQENVNPYVEIPDLCEYVWGAKCNEAFSYTEPVYAPARPEAPTFGKYDLAGVNTWTGTWWEAMNLTLSGDGDIYWTTTDSDDYELYQGGIAIGAAGKGGETVTVKAFCRGSWQGRDYDSSVATLTLTARDPSVTDLGGARWERVTANSQINTDDQYIILSLDNAATMACSKGSGNFVADAGAATRLDDVDTRLPAGAAVVSFLPAGGSMLYLQLSDVTLQEKGCLSTTAARNMSIAAQGTPAAVSINPVRGLNVDFGSSLGTLQYNKTSPRFLNYTSTQGKVALYVCRNQSTTAPLPVVSPQGEEVWYDLQGRRVDIEKAQPGVYIRVGKGAKMMKMMKTR